MEGINVMHDAPCQQVCIWYALYSGKGKAVKFLVHIVGWMFTIDWLLGGSPNTLVAGRRECA